MTNNPEWKIRHSMTRAFGGKQDALRAHKATVGLPDGTVDAGYPGYIYVVTPGAVEIAYNSTIVASAGMEVLVGYDPRQPGSMLKVLDASGNFPTIGSTSSAAPGSASYAPSSRYRFGGADPLWVELRAITWLRTTLEGGLFVSVYPGFIRNSTGVIQLVAFQRLNLTSSVPAVAGKSRWALVYVDDTGTLQSAVSEPVDSASLTVAMIPNIETSVRDSSAIRLYHGMSDIIEEDVWDLRFGTSPRGGGGGGSLSLQSNGVDQPTEDKLNLIGFDVQDDPANDRTNVQLPANLRVDSPIGKIVYGQEKLFEYVSDGTKGSVLFNLSTNTFDTITIQVINAKSTVNANYGIVYVAPNGDKTFGHFIHTLIYATAGTNGNASQTTISDPRLGNITGATATGITNLETVINSCSSVGPKQFLVDGAYDLGGAGAYLTKAMLRWTDTAAINSLEIYLDSGLFATGTIIRILGTKNLLTSNSPDTAYIGQQLFRSLVPAGGLSYAYADIPSGTDRVEIELLTKTNDLVYPMDDLEIDLNGDTNYANYTWAEHYGGGGHNTGYGPYRTISYIPNTASGYISRVKAVIFSPCSDQEKIVASETETTSPWGHLIFHMSVRWKTDPITSVKIHLPYATGAKFIEGSLILITAYRNFVMPSKELFTRIVERQAGNGGTHTAGVWQKRMPNLIDKDEIGVSLVDGQFTLPAGIYNVDIKAPSANTYAHQIKLVNVTDALDALYGTYEWTYGIQSWSQITNKLIITKTTTFEIQHRAYQTSADIGLGLAAAWSGVPNDYTTILLRKIG